MNSHLLRRSCLVLAMAIPLAGHAADCAVVFGQGRPPPSPDSQVNDHWNRLNFSFHDAFQELLAEGGLKVVPVFLSVQAADLAANAERVRRAAADAGCSRLVSTRVFSDDAKATPELVFAVSASAVKFATGAQAQVDKADYTKEYRFPATPAALAGVVPSRLAAQAARDLPEAWKR
jgi:hypothetical protein